MAGTLIVVVCPKCGVERTYHITIVSGTVLLGCKHCRRSFRITVQNGQLYSIER